jgi:uncharacterized protein (TIGR02680 family)
MNEVSLPAPGRDRFQPLRSGLVNLYRYDDQELWFEGGHLLLRGNNGTGKSRVLALQLPFLLDGDVAPHRMEPDGDPAKRVEWNLLLGGRYADRVGYTWLEFGRRAPELAAGEEFVTIGCGLSAVTGRGLVGKWFFVTPKRIGRDLFLVAPSGQPLSRERLAESIGAENVHVTAAAYREAVDGALFGLGKARYEALINLLIQLRQPQLSRQLDEEKLSKALSESLPPLAAHVVADVAEAFRALEADASALSGFRMAGRAVEQFLVDYRRYAQIAARRRAGAVRGRHSAYEEAMRVLREAERSLARAEEVERGIVAELERGSEDEQAAAAAVEALAASPEMQGAQALRRARDAAESAAGDVTRQEEALAGRRAALLRRTADRDEALRSVESATTATASRHQSLRRAAIAAGFERRHDQAVRTAPDEAVVRALEALAAERRRALKHLRRLANELGRAEGALAIAEGTVRQREGDVEEASVAQATAADALKSAAERLLEAYRVWAGGTRLLAPAAPEEVVDAFAAWVDDVSGPSPLRAVVDRALAEALERLGARALDAEARVAGARERLAELRAERERVAAGAHRPPPLAPTRDEEARRTRDGAPLWRLVDFRPDVASDQRAGIEAALEGAGILDAWVAPDGRMLGADERDVLLVAGGTAPVVSGRNLGAVLRPAVNREDARAALVANGTVVALLERIGLGLDAPSPAAVDEEGRFRLGPLEGRHAKPAAEHIGEGAREAARQRRLAELAALIADGEVDEERAARDEAEARAEMSAARAEGAAAPDDRPVLLASTELEVKEGALQTARTRLAAAQDEAFTAAGERDKRRRAGELAAADLGVERFPADLEVAEEGLASYGAEIAALGPVIEHQRAATRARERADILAEEAAVETAKAEEHLGELRGRSAALAAERDVLDASVGVSAEAVLARYTEAQGTLRKLRAHLRELAERRQTEHDGAVRGRAALETAQRDLVAIEDQRAAAAAALGRVAGTRLLAVAVPELAGDSEAPWSITRTVDVARAVEAALGQVDVSDAASDRTARSVLSNIQALEQALLPQGHQTVTTIEDDLVVVTMPFQGRTHTMAEFGEILASEVESRQALLSAREREVLENHLVGEVSMHLHDRLHAAERLVREMNEELAARPMSTGMTLRFAWKPLLDDGPPGLAEARKRLMRAGGTWSPAERQALGAFLQKRIEDVRAANQIGSWQDHLAEALDYRSWHRFGIERQQDGIWKPLTRRTHGTGSGGEKAVALTLPQFAAAAAHYRSAGPRAPRLILLDEVFVGVDSDMRGKCMGLLATFDLDFVMTSEREWGCYPTLPALAIYQLATRPEIDAVGTTRFVWNGRERIRAEVTAPGARAPAAHPGEDAALALATAGES